MITIETLTAVTRPALQDLISGYTSPAKYMVRKSESEARIALELHLMPLPMPYSKHYDLLDDETYSRYQQALQAGFSLGAYAASGQLVGIALAAPQHWNSSLWVWEFHVAAAHQRQGIGRQLMETLAVKGRAAGLRVLVCETQNTNVPAIHFYQRLGFTLEGIDLSYYSNADWPDGEIAVFMKRRL